jgi:hypothetical protein
VDARPDGARSENKNGDEIIPRKNEILHAESPLLGGINPPKIPLMPRTRPLSNIKRAEESPSKSPPMREVQGVK